MFKKTATRLFFYLLLFISNSLFAADNVQEFNIMGYQRDSVKYPKRVPDKEFEEMLSYYRTDLPSAQRAERAVKRMAEQHQFLGMIINCVKNPDLYKQVPYPSRLLFTGPSGFGKTYAAKALAKYWEADCVYVEGPSVGDARRNSGAEFISNLFAGLLERPEKSFVVIIDEIMPVIKYIDPRDDQIGQNAMVSAFCCALDDCESRRNVCVIGTGEIDPAQLSDRIKTRFAYDIFTFNRQPTNHLVDIMKECLDYDLLPSGGHVNACSDEFLMQLAKSIEYRSIREIEDLIEESKSYAIDEVEQAGAIVTEEHLRYIFNEYRDPTWLEKVWANRDKHLQNLTSARAISLYMAVGGIGLSSQDYKCGLMLMGLGGFVNIYWAKGKDLQLFELLSHLSAQHEIRRQWAKSIS